MPRSYINAFPDIRGQGYERTAYAETQASPIDTAGDIYGITGSVISSFGSGVTQVVRRYRYRLAWNFLTTERAVDVEYAVDLCANGSGAPIPFLEWEVTDESDYQVIESVGNPTFAFPMIQPAGFTGDGSVMPVHWWDVQSFVLVDVGGGAIGNGWPIDSTGTYTITVDDSWLGNIPSLLVPDWAPNVIGGAYVTGRRIRMVTVEPDSYTREKARQPDLWMVNVTLIEKEIGIAPGYYRASSDLIIEEGP